VAESVSVQAQLKTIRQQLPKEAGDPDIVLMSGAATLL